MIHRRSFLAAPVAAAAAALPPIAPALARAPLAGPSAAFYRFKVGAFEVTALGDGTLTFPADASVFPSAGREPEAAARILAQNAVGPGPTPVWVNTYLVNTGDRLVLVDTGAGTLQAFGPTLGRLPRNLAAAGVTPGAIDVVILTHLHPDHEAGLAPDGSPAFPNAELVVHAPEHAFWTNDGAMSRTPADFRPFFTMAREAVAPYAARLRLAQPGEVVPGLFLESAPGHTPGHAAVRVSSGGAQFLIWGDALHAAALQFDRPDWSMAFDTDQAQSAATRRRLLDMAAQDRLLIAAMHLPFPGIGRVGRRGDAYTYVPEPWQAG
jgi:glyoxylase-like metal-dependent hydrolase (beta-lactamase superfamily II)